MAKVKHICPDWHGCHKPPFSKIFIFQSECIWTKEETVDISICPRCLMIAKQQIEELSPPYKIVRTRDQFKPRVDGSGGGDNIKRN